MGNPLQLSNIDADVDDEILRCVKSVKDLNPQNIKIFLEHFFGGMSLVAKETVVDVLWASMTMREQHLFDMPTSDRRLTEEEICRNFGSAEMNVMPRRVVRALQQEPNGAVGRSLRNRTGFTQVWPRMGFGRAIETNSDESLSNAQVGVETLTPENGWRRNVANQRPGSPIGDHILSLLMDVVMRAEQGSNSSLARTAGGSAPQTDAEQSARRSRQ